MGGGLCVLIDNERVYLSRSRHRKLWCQSMSKLNTRSMHRLRTTRREEAGVSAGHIVNWSNEPLNRVSQCGRLKWRLQLSLRGFAIPTFSFFRVERAGIDHTSRMDQAEVFIET